MNARTYVVTALLLLVAACSSSKPIVNVVNEPLGSEQSMAAVHEAIFAAGHAHGWVMKDAGSASIVATLDVRGHHVVVNIDYSTTEFSISYVDSADMDAKNCIPLISFILKMAHPSKTTLPLCWNIEPPGCVFRPRTVPLSVISWSFATFRS